MAQGDKQQFVIVDDANGIQAMILIRGDEFYCFERLDDGPRNLKEAMKEYPDCKLVPVKLSVDAPAAQKV